MEPYLHSHICHNIWMLMRRAKFPFLFIFEQLTVTVRKCKFTVSLFVNSETVSWENSGTTANGYGVVQDYF
jgi:hypothetical protein